MSTGSCIEAMITLLTDKTQPTYVDELKDHVYDWQAAPDPLTVQQAPFVILLDSQWIPERRIAGPACLGLHETRWWLEAQVVQFIGADLTKATGFRDLVLRVQAAMRKPRFAGLADTAETQVLWSGDNMRVQYMAPRNVGTGMKRQHAVLRVEVIEEMVA